MTAPPLPRWPALPLALLCAFAYAWVGTGHTFRFIPSRHTHQSLTAAAWLHGRLYCTADELERQFFIRQLRMFNQTIPPGTPTAELRLAYREFCLLTGMRKFIEKEGLPLTEENIESHFRVHLERGPYHDWVPIPAEPASAGPTATPTGAKVTERFYAYWPPLSALLMLPFVALFGPEISDVLVTNLIGATTVAAIWFMLRALQRLWPRLTMPACVVLTLAYGLGTCHFYQAAVGQTWALVQLTGTLVLTLAIAAALRGWSETSAGEAEAAASTTGAQGTQDRGGTASSSGTQSKAGGAASSSAAPSSATQGRGWFLIAALFVALAFLSRSTLILAAPFLFHARWSSLRGAAGRLPSFLKDSALIAAILTVGIAVQLAFNAARFGSLLDFGQGRLADAGGHPRFINDYHKYGRFHIHYLPINIWYYFLNTQLKPHTADGRISFDGEGNSLLLVSPFMIYALLAWRRRAAAGLPLPFAAFGLVGVFLTILAADLFPLENRSGRSVMGMMLVGVVVLLLLAFLVRSFLQRDPLLTAVLIGAIPGTTLLMLFHATGWFQFGQRYLLDTMPFLLLLAAFGVRGRAAPLLCLLTAAAIGVNYVGAEHFYLKLLLL